MPYLPVHLPPSFRYPTVGFHLSSHSSLERHTPTPHRPTCLPTPHRCLRRACCLTGSTPLFCCTAPHTLHLHISPACCARVLRTPRVMEAPPPLPAGLCSLRYYQVILVPILPPCAVPILHVWEDLPFAITCHSTAAIRYTHATTVHYCSSATLQLGCRFGFTAFTAPYVLPAYTRATQRCYTTLPGLRYLPFAAAAPTFPTTRSTPYHLTAATVSFRGSAILRHRARFGYALGHMPARLPHARLPCRTRAGCYTRCTPPFWFLGLHFGRDTYLGSPCLLPPFTHTFIWLHHTTPITHRY